MFNKEQIISLAEFIKIYCPKDSKELIDALSFVNLALDGVYDSANDIVNSHISSRTLDKVTPLLEKMESVIEIKKSVDGYILMLEDEEALEGEIEADNMDEEEERRQLPNYAAYYIDTAVPHTLYEDFTHTKACGFSLSGKYYDAKNMRGVIVKLCEILSDIDAKKLFGFCDDGFMQGTKVKYFAKEQIVEKNQVKNEEIQNLGVYVWVGASCNQLRNIIMKVLKKYDIPYSEFKIFLRADYKELHDKKDVTIQLEANPDNSSEKIGKYIANIMRGLSESNYEFTQNELIALQSETWTKQTFGIGMPFLKKYDAKRSISEQIKINPNNRYWRERYEFNGEEYFVVSQWYEKHRDKFDAWIKQLDREV